VEEGEAVEALQAAASSQHVDEEMPMSIQVQPRVMLARREARIPGLSSMKRRMRWRYIPLLV
jgi:hypothetical protein